MKRLLIFILLFVVALIATANKPSRTAYTTSGTDYYTLPKGIGYVSDSLFSGEADTLTFWIAPKTQWFSFSIRPVVFASDATDTLIVKYRVLPSITMTDNTAGSPFTTLNLVNESGVAVSSLDWTSGSLYYIESGFAPYYSKYIQFLLYNGLATGDTSLYQAWFQQGSASE